MESRSFTAKINQVGNSVGVPIPFDPDEVWGAKERHDVSGTIDGYSIRGPLSRSGDGFFLALGPSWRRDNPLDISQEVAVAIKPEGPQMDNIAPDIAHALGGAPDAYAFFHSIAPFYRKNYMRWIESARRPETRAARIAEMVTLLNEKKRAK